MGLAFGHCVHVSRITLCATKRLTRRRRHDTPPKVGHRPNMGAAKRQGGLLLNRHHHQQQQQQRRRGSVIVCGRACILLVLLVPCALWWYTYWNGTQLFQASSDRQRRFCAALPLSSSLVESAPEQKRRSISLVVPLVPSSSSSRRPTTNSKHSLVQRQDEQQQQQQQLLIKALRGKRCLEQQIANLTVNVVLLTAAISSSSDTTTNAVTTTARRANNNNNNNNNNTPSSVPWLELSYDEYRSMLAIQEQWLQQRYPDDVLDRGVTFTETTLNVWSLSDDAVSSCRSVAQHLQTLWQHQELVLLCSSSLQDHNSNHHDYSPPNPWRQPRWTRLRRRRDQNLTLPFVVAVAAANEQ
jgi:hypothetical protein